MRAHWKLMAWIASAALLLAALVPDFSHDSVSFAVIQIIAPLAIAGPAAYAVVLGRAPVLVGVSFALVGVLLHSLMSGAIYRFSAGYAAFHDGVSVPVLLASFGLKVLAVVVIFMLGWVIHWLAKKARGVPSGL